MLTELGIYGGLFFNAFIAATLLPAFSELSFAASLTNGIGTPIILFFAVTSGNVLGAIVNWWLGSKLTHFQDKRWFPFSSDQISRATVQFEKYGKWSLLFAWLPIVGDPITLVAGILRTNFRFFILAVTIGKAARYTLIWITISAL